MQNPSTIPISSNYPTRLILLRRGKNESNGCSALPIIGIKFTNTIVIPEKVDVVPRDCLNTTISRIRGRCSERICSISKPLNVLIVDFRDKIIGIACGVACCCACVDGVDFG